VDIWDPPYREDISLRSLLSCAKLAATCVAFEKRKYTLRDNIDIHYCWSFTIKVLLLPGPSVCCSIDIDGIVINFRSQKRDCLTVNPIFSLGPIQTILLRWELCVDFIHTAKFLRTCSASQFSTTCRGDIIRIDN
jgi:hypothetical protein